MTDNEKLLDGNGVKYLWDKMRSYMNDAETGSSLPPGGTAGQVLTKKSNKDGDVYWGAVSSEGGGGSLLEISFGEFFKGGSYFLTDGTDGKSGTVPESLKVVVSLQNINSTYTVSCEDSSGDVVVSKEVSTDEFYSQYFIELNVFDITVRSTIGSNISCVGSKESMEIVSTGEDLIIVRYPDSYTITSSYEKYNKTTTIETSDEERVFDIDLRFTEPMTNILTESGTWKVPSGIEIDDEIHVRVFGAGGNGGKAGSNSGSGGGGGGEMQTKIISINPDQEYIVTIGDPPGGASSFGNVVTANGGNNGLDGNGDYSGDGGNGGTGGGGAGSSGSSVKSAGGGGKGQYGGGGGSGFCVNTKKPGGAGGEYGGGGGAPWYNSAGSTGGAGGTHGGTGGSMNVRPTNGKNTVDLNLDFVGEGLAGAEAGVGTGRGAGGGGGGYGGNGGAGGGGGGGGGGYGGNGGAGGGYGGGGGGGYGGNGGNGNNAGGGGGGYGKNGSGGNGELINNAFATDGGYAAGGGGAIFQTSSPGKGGPGIIIVTYQKFIRSVSEIEAEEKT